MIYSYDPLATYSQRRGRAEQLVEFRCEIEGDGEFHRYSSVAL